ncbi:DUF2628 domain-containing protein [Blastochloris sulfoviridis]|uniref:DUF2628 domain-containing protein n=1 Tax=Blastochloris sulfoviridis TaxID=50712 RepID=A0A5M6HWX9_9HYPH|nr:DUF2628 domain-containing protein [Blastochloris sulfoviridis]KAA5600422.1 DUF2628 domain-containing protein [Blastochloris sulfoviridis]
MALWTVHEPPPRGRGPLDQADRIVFVRDGLSWAALLVPLIWLAARRLWLALVFYVVILTLVTVAFQAADLPAWGMVAGAAMSVILGLEAAGLRRWTLGRRGFKPVAVISAPTLDEAERRFFAGWPGAASPPQAARPATAGVIGTAAMVAR